MSAKKLAGKRAAVVCLLIAAAIGEWCLAQGQPGLSISVHTESGMPIVGAAVRVEGSGGFRNDVITSADGDAAIPRLTAGEYRITIVSDGFEQSARSVSVQDERQEIQIEFTLVSKLRRQENVDVVADAHEVELQGAAPAASELRSTDVAALPLRPSTVTDALPLVPGVQRTSDGEIQISGQGEQRSSLLVNATDVTDPTTGRFGTTVPVDAVESIDVLKSPFLPQYGRFTSGVVSVSTRRGGEHWRFTLKEPFPSFRIRSAHIRGLRDTLPRLSFSGPLIKDRLFFSESVQYRLEKKQTRTLSFPHNESKDELVNSFSQFDYIVSPSHFVTASAHVTPHHIDFVDPQFFNPQPVTPSFRGYDHVFSMADHAATMGGLLDSTVSQQVFRARIGAQGEAEMVLTPTGNTGNYFARRSRNASRTEWMETFSVNKGSAHALKFGSVVGHVATGGDFDFRPVEIRDSSGQKLQRIEFTPGSSFEKSDMEEAVFLQDHWTLRPNFALDAGGRVEHQTNTSTWRAAPRVGAAWTPLPHDPMVVRAGFGFFYDRVPLSVYSFRHHPEQTVIDYDPTGQSGPVERHFSNIMDVDPNNVALVSRRMLRGNFAPYSRAWTIETERTLGRVLHLRANYQSSRAGGGILLTPGTNDGINVHALGAGGRSRYRQFEVTARLSWQRGQQMLFSYVRSKALGDINSFDAYLGDFPTAPLRPNQYSNTRADIPNRFIAWGFINMPWKVRLSPVFEYRTGQPYALVEERRNYVGIPYGDKTRFRSYVDLDERMSRDFKLVSKYTFRISVSALNVLNHFNPLEVHANTADPQLGVFFGHHKRRYRADFELVF